MKRTRAKIWIDLTDNKWGTSEFYMSEGLDGDTCDTISSELDIHGIHQIKLSTNINRYSNKLKGTRDDTSDGTNYSLNGEDYLWFCNEGLIKLLGHIPDAISFEVVK